MYFTRRLIGAETYLYYPYEKEDLIQYQYDMINNSNQALLSKINLTGGSFEHCVTSYLPLGLYFKSLNNDMKAIHVLFLKMIECMDRLEAYLLNMNQVVLEKDFIYYDISTGEMRFIYLPLVSYTCKDQQVKMKKICLSLMYEYMSFEGLTDHQDLIEMLQSEAIDIFALKMFLVEPPKKISHKKKGWLQKLLEKKPKKNDKIETQIHDKETVVLPSVEAPVLVFGKKRITIHKSSFLIGRSATLNDFAMPEALTMGRVHVEIKEEDGHYAIIDLNSKNGTYINNKRIESQKKYRLTPGDRIDLGQEKGVFQ